MELRVDQTSGSLGAEVHLSKTGVQPPNSPCKTLHRTWVRPKQTCYRYVEVFLWRYVIKVHLQYCKGIVRIKFDPIFAQVTEM